MAHPAIVQSVINYFEKSKFAEFRVRDEVKIAIGARQGLADIVLSDKDGRFFAIAECKPWDQKDSGRLQLKCYLAASGTRFGLLAAGASWEFWENKGANKFQLITKVDFEFGVLNDSPGVFNPELMPNSASQVVETVRATSVETRRPQSTRRKDRWRHGKESRRGETNQAVEAVRAISVETRRPQLTRRWKYATLVLGIGLALSFVMMLMLLFKPLDSKAYIERGKAKADKGQHFEAIGDYDMAISLNPDNARAYYYRGLAKEKTDRGRGREDLQKALKFAEKAKAWDLHRTIKQKIKLLDFLESLPSIPDD